MESSRNLENSMRYISFDNKNSNYLDFTFLDEFLNNYPLKTMGVLAASRI